MEVDDCVVLRGVSWSQYESLLAARGETARPRMAYLSGELELMSPSRSHETLKGLFGRLLEAYAEENEIDLQSYESMTLRNAARARGAEPDKSYALGGPKDRPDLAVEIVWTSGGLDKLEIYRGLGIPEVWMWENQVLSVHVLRGDKYVEAERSELLPDLDLELLARYLGADAHSQAVREYREALRSRSIER
jgi:Uma2 family endonuclease